MKLKVGTRRSPLALAQTHYIIDLVRARHPEVEFEVCTIATMADKDRVSEFHQFGIVGIFSVEHEEQLISKEVDIVVHSLKDLPTTLRDGLVLAAVPDRMDPRDTLCGSMIADLPEGARVGTGSLRRKAQILSLRQDVDVVAIRGNIGPRLQRVEGENPLDAVILAQAGLDRLSIGSEIAEPFDPVLFPYAVGQGALGVQSRDDDDRLLEILRSIENPQARAEVDAERAMMHALGAGCSLPVGVVSQWKEGSLVLQGQVTSLDGTERVVAVEDGSADKAEEIGLAAAETLKQCGGVKILETSYRDYCQHFKMLQN